jgi:hypothetical protein
MGLDEVGATVGAAKLEWFVGQGYIVWHAAVELGLVSLCVVSELRRDYLFPLGTTTRGVCGVGAFRDRRVYHRGWLDG